MEKEQSDIGQKGICPVCNQAMIFYPGCCGYLPLWRCDDCGHLTKWTEKSVEIDNYLKLK